MNLHILSIKNLESIDLQVFSFLGLGHTKLSTTQIYARVLETKVSADMLLLKEKIEAQKI